jgi:hypothetical protein
VHAKSPSLLVAVLVTSAIALLDAGTGDRAILLGLLIAGPLLVAASLDAPRTAMVGLYALGLAVLLGIPDRIVGTIDHLLGCLVVATGGALGAWGAHRRTQQERTLLRVTRIAEVAQQTILRPIPPRMGRVTLAVRYLSATEDALVGGDFYEVAVTRHGLRVLVGDVKGKGLEAVQLAALVLAGFRAAAAHPGLAELAGELDHSIRPRLGEGTSSPRCWPSSAATASCSWSTAATQRRCGSGPGPSSGWPVRSRPPRWGWTPPRPFSGSPWPPAIGCCCTPTGWWRRGRPTGGRLRWTARCRRWVPRPRWARRWMGWLGGCWSMRGAAWTTIWRWCWRSLAGDRRDHPNRWRIQAWSISAVVTALKAARSIPVG